MGAGEQRRERQDRRRVVVVGHHLDVHAPAPSVGVLDVDLRVGIQHLIVIDDVEPERLRGCALRLVGGAIHGRVVGQLSGLDEPGPRLLLGDVAGVDRRALRGVSPAFGRGEDLERVAFRVRCV